MQSDGSIVVRYRTRKPSRSRVLDGRQCILAVFPLQRDQRSVRLSLSIRCRRSEVTPTHSYAFASSGANALRPADVAIAPLYSRSVVQQTSATVDMPPIASASNQSGPDIT
jgi:hypothetical protein